MIKPTSNDASFSTVSVEDGAIESTDEELAAFVQESLKNPGCDWKSMLKVRDGDSPTVFVMGVIPPSEMNRIQDECLASERYNEMYWRAFLHSLRKIEGLSDKPKNKTIGDVEYIDPDWTREKFSRSLRKIGIEVGMRAWAWNNLSERDAKN